MISVIIPTYNRVNKLKRALESVLNQTAKDIEILIIDNGSTDGTIEFLKSIANEKVKYYINKQSGANFSRNLGIKKSKGDYIAFLDDDDEWEYSKLEKQRKILDANHEVGLCYTGKKIIYEEYKIKYNSYSHSSKNIYLGNFIGTTSSVMIRKKIFEKSGYFDVNLPALQDYELWMRILKYTEVYEIKEPLINYYISSNNNQISNSIVKFEEAIRKIYLKNKDNFLFLKNYENRKMNIEEEIILRKIREGHAINTEEIKNIKNKIKAKIYLKISIKKMLYLKMYSSKIKDFKYYLKKLIKNKNTV